MSRIDETFARLREEGRAAFMPFVTAGDPDLGVTRRVLLAMARAGADLIEVGIPFSDSIADGPTIQQANLRALRAGTTLAGVLETVRSVRAETDVPLVLMGSYNPVFVHGVEAFCREAAAAGADGLIIPDLLVDDAEELVRPARAAGLDTIFLVAPTSTDARLRRVAAAASGFVYAVSLTGVTGERQELAADLNDFLDRVRAAVSLPVAVGFGISTPAMAAQAARHADGVIIGSAIVKRLAAAAAAGEDPAAAAAAFVGEVSGALRRP
jgi:tryptophan synthase alpha chain